MSDPTFWCRSTLESRRTLDDSLHGNRRNVVACGFLQMTVPLSGSYVNPDSIYEHVDESRHCHPSTDILIPYREVTYGCLASCGENYVNAHQRMTSVLMHLVPALRMVRGVIPPCSEKDKVHKTSLIHAYEYLTNDAHQRRQI